ncbi:MAG TPA: hypothetical protein PLB90_13715, partial [Opitutaceae bacterium]|nr:hypothetical protein [Opitutaceae bacterium]
MNLPAALRSRCSLAGLHHALPWIFAATFAGAAELVAQRLGLVGEGRSLVRSAALSTVVVLLAVHRAWLHDRAGLESVGYAVVAAAVGGFAWGLPPVFRLVPALVLGAALPVYTAWRFLPDRGQSGRWWALRPGLRRAV